MAGGAFRVGGATRGGPLPHAAPELLVRGVVGGPVDAVAGAFGSPYVSGAVEIAREGASLTATVRDGDGPLVAEVTLPALRAIDPAMLRWDAWLGFAGPGDNIDLIEYGPKFEPATGVPFKGRNRRVTSGAGTPGLASAA